MPATPEELQQVIETFERAHPLIVRALADLQLRGNIVLEQHGFLGSMVEDKFGEFILTTLKEHGFSTESFAAALRDLEKMYLTINELEQLP